MNKDEKRLIYLFNCYLKNQCNELEKTELSQLLILLDDDAIAQVLESCWMDFESNKKLSSDESKVILELILRKKKAILPKNRLIKFYRILGSIAALFVLFISIQYCINLYNRPSHLPLTKAALNISKPDIAPGKSGAILTLADGSQILIDSQRNNSNILAKQSGVNILLENGKIVYSNPSQAQVSDNVANNVMSTPRGRTFKLQLPDGTNVWLNAESSISYPVQFNANIREVSITGEAYFEVAKLYQKNKRDRVPFIVHIQPSDDRADVAKVEVLGTHFDIKAYAGDKTVKTTLLEGSVKVWGGNGKEFAQIKPGMQAEISNNKSKEIIVENVDTSDAVAWKSGYFNFNNVNLREVMRELSRWYNVEVVYNGSIPERHFWGKMQKKLYLSQVLSALQKMDVKFNINDRKIIVSN